MTNYAIDILRARQSHIETSMRMFAGRGDAQTAAHIVQQQQEYDALTVAIEKLSAKKDIRGLIEENKGLIYRNGNLEKNLKDLVNKNRVLTYLGREMLRVIPGTALNFDLIEKAERILK